MPLKLTSLLSAASAALPLALLLSFTLPASAQTSCPCTINRRCATADQCAAAGQVIGAVFGSLAAVGFMVFLFICVCIRARRLYCCPCQTRVNGSYVRNIYCMSPSGSCCSAEAPPGAPCCLSEGEYVGAMSARATAQIVAAVPVYGTAAVPMAMPVMMQPGGMMQPGMGYPNYPPAGYPPQGYPPQGQGYPQGQYGGQGYSPYPGGYANQGGYPAPQQQQYAAGDPTQPGQYPPQQQYPQQQQQQQQYQQGAPNGGYPGGYPSMPAPPNPVDKAYGL